ncbi:MAG: efflux RND transporter periplasmic adaptor subunit [Thiobacillus sp.]|uniref:efflux RND transporter periplasmic adaptor subunit n=1 Tax=Thiobacillus sp. TaxID=924 RepID=UPI002896257E|nr:efflux RND transporter periplasmic adaptor subunit [Thiobacillus sp.]MDT3706026.1 efflux RND transporter periplasmic adaptor subunit [Thiobacillus sp.]
MRMIGTAVVVLSLILVAGCQKESAEKKTEAPPPIVQTVHPAPASGVGLQLSATLRARIEAPLAFQVGGRITARRVDAGQAVRAGQPLFELDPADLDEAVRAGAADLAAADIGLKTAEADVARNRELHAQSFISAQALERTELVLREARSRRDAAAARLAQNRNARGYGVLTSPAAGVLIDVTAEPGQVVAAGQPVAILARAGARELEVSFPDDVAPPARGEAILPDGKTIPIILREAAPSVEPLGRTRRARYTLTRPPDDLVLGSVVGARFMEASGAGAVWTVPIGAVDERGKAARVWRLRNGKVEPVAVQVLALDDRSARIAGPLAASDTVVALGAHLLREGMTVRERTQ